MTNDKNKLQAWPREDQGRPILTSTNEAKRYARLIYENKYMIELVEDCLKKTKTDAKAARDTVNLMLENLMELQTKAQFFRECLEEVTRITVHPYVSALNT